MRLQQWSDSVKACERGPAMSEGGWGSTAADALQATKPAARTPIVVLIIEGRPKSRGRHPQRS